MFNRVFKLLGTECSVCERKTNKIYSSTISMNHIFPGEVKVGFLPSRQEHNTSLLP